MANVSIVLVSHSSKVTEGIRDIITQMVPAVSIGVAGGTEEGEIGTNIDKIKQAIEEVQGEKGVLLFYDIGSAKMNAELAVEMNEYKNVHVVEAPILEGAFVAAVEAGMGKSLEEVQAAAEKNYRD
ncbi:MULTISPECIES: dihydroxyacetone kinase phosphoryl donor subunit DhaM [Oceanobacillus]|uniref:phosphoenolpyruvate--glycerone phosphotransferase n=1 Tax=Oceanobacillus indicireducens TaxID=1004261 RepID=A0A917XSF8_9BACI|nr:MULTISPECIES: dihydroxyacetone kinase phosphoryl donor subunit DhaM [Oceanobacillus]MCG5105321.1 PTS-dependent dihydroxyacetone kinase phosphotransferase subunit DhaM [Oceanobacillus alkalisoli]GGN51065.1 PTS-dependent dihydroxyacetone kinase phosphotransferase subunit DhaM [Oceanobacillus indicireducens]